ncbi:lamin tail domain-containing protein [Demequina maris]|uniref:lamin tail domain-containing protein n=1 Tax=Demequina maris TaxID=1638982 RepID=UPI0007844AEA|nr:lamin tail domain-containing protein [Demequina maris]
MLVARRLATIVAAIAIALFASVSSTTTAEAAANVRFSYVQYNSPGSDYGSNYSLNQEYIKIKNYGAKAKQLKGWTVRDAAGHVYTFGYLNLKPGATVTLHTGKGSNTVKHRYWKQTWYIWNNDGDKAVLKNSRGVTLDACKWGSSGSAKAC